KLGTRIAVIDVVGMFPDVAGQQRRSAVSHRVVGVAGAYDGQRAIGFLYQPAPAGAESGNRSLAELFLELVEGSERLVDGFGQFASRLAAAVRAQAVPEESVVPDLGSVVENAAAGGLDDGLQVLAFKLSARNQVVQVGYIGVVVLVVVKFQRLGRHV